MEDRTSQTSDFSNDLQTEATNLFSTAAVQSVLYNTEMSAYSPIRTEGKLSSGTVGYSLPSINGCSYSILKKSYHDF